MHTHSTIGLGLLLIGLIGCSGPADTVEQAQPGESTGTTTSEPAPVESELAPEAAAGGKWSDGDTIPSGVPGVPDIQILQVHANGSGDECGRGKTASLKYKAMLADGKVLDPGTRPFTFKVGAKQAIDAWDIIVAQMRVGDSFTVLVPQQLAYGPSKGDLKFDMELLTVR